jgi:phage shock protein A
MFKRFREKIEKALERQEARRPLSNEEVDALLRAMRQELIDLRARIPKLEREATELDRRAKQALERAEFAHGKAQEAEAAGKLEEARVAADAARRALDGAEELRRQAEELRAELESLKAEAFDKMEQLKQAEHSRGALVARSRRTTTAARLDEMLRGPESGAKRFDRAEEAMQTADDLAEAEREVSEALGERPSARDLDAEYELRKLEAARRAEDVERRLEDLKRQLEDGE